MKYTFLFGEARAGEKADKHVLETRAGESQRHILLKALAYVLFYEDRPRIELRVSESKRDYKPDLVAVGAEGEVNLWVDCGQITLKKVDDLSRRFPRARVVIVKATASEMEGYAREAAKKVKRLDNVTFLGFDPELIPALTAAMGHVNTLHWRREGDRLSLVLNDRPFESRIHRLGPAAY